MSAFSAACNQQEYKDASPFIKWNFKILSGKVIYISLHMIEPLWERFQLRSPQYILIWFDLILVLFMYCFFLDLITQVYRGKELKTAMDSVLAGPKREFSRGLFSLTFRVCWKVKTWIKYLFGKWNLYSWVRGRVYCLRFAEGHHRSTCLQWPMCIRHLRQVNLWWPGHCQSTCTCLQWLM